MKWSRCGKSAARTSGFGDVLKRDGTVIVTRRCAHKHANGGRYMTAVCYTCYRPARTGYVRQSIALILALGAHPVALFYAPRRAHILPLDRPPSPEILCHSISIRAGTTSPSDYLHRALFTVALPNTHAKSTTKTKIQTNRQKIVTDKIATNYCLVCGSNEHLIPLSRQKKSCLRCNEYRLTRHSVNDLRGPSPCFVAV